MTTLLPHQAVGQLIAASDKGKPSRRPEHQAGIGDVNGRSAYAEAPGTVLIAGRCLWRAEEEVGEAHVVNEVRRHSAGEREDTLIHPVLDARPTRRQSVVAQDGG